MEMLPRKGIVIAIDGPAGTGKSSVTRRLAQALGYVVVDTGALYRAIAYVAYKNKLLEADGSLDSANSSAVAEIARKVHLEFKRKEKLNPSNRIFADGEDVTPFIRSPEMSMGASAVSAIPEVRAALLGIQRRLGCMNNSILEGRDIGTVVFPDANIKFFLTATLDERARRRVDELETLGADTPSFEEIREQIKKRDEGDQGRKIAPLKKADDAILFDTTSFTLDQVVEGLLEQIEKHLGISSGKTK